MDHDEIRISAAEREHALTALAAHFEAGRLDAFEYEDRRGKAGDALARCELDAVFTDLPGTDQQPRADVASHAGGCGQQRSARRPARCSRDGIYPIVLFVAVALFQLTHSWVWFLMIPMSGALVSLVRPRSAGPENHGRARS